MAKLPPLHITQDRLTCRDCGRRFQSGVLHVKRGTVVAASCYTCVKNPPPMTLENLGLVRKKTASHAQRS